MSDALRQAETAIAHAQVTCADTTTMRHLKVAEAALLDLRRAADDPPCRRQLPTVGRPADEDMETKFGLNDAERQAEFQAELDAIERAGRATDLPPGPIGSTR